MKEKRQIGERDCPFCGATHYALYHRHNEGGYVVHCSDCKANGPEGNSKKKATNYWNDRT